MTFCWQALRDGENGGEIIGGGGWQVMRQPGSTQSVGPLRWKGLQGMALRRSRDAGVLGEHASSLHPDVQAMEE